MPQSRTSEGDRTYRRLVLACVIAVAAPFLLVGVPFGIGEHCPVVFVPWSAGEALACCGALSAACVAIYGVYCTLRDNRVAREEQIRYDREARENQLREAAAPYFSVVFLEQEGRRTWVDEMLDGTETAGVSEETDNPRAYQEVEDRCLFVTMGEGVEYHGQLGESKLELVKSTFVKEYDANGAKLCLHNLVIYVPLKMRNTGPGAASSVRVGVNRKGDERSGPCSFVLDHGEEFYLGIYVDTSQGGVFGEYEIRIAFSDCLGCQYKQTFGLNIVKAGRERNGERSRVDVAYVGSRRLLDDKERQTYLQSVASATSNEGSGERR